LACDAPAGTAASIAATAVVAMVRIIPVVIVPKSLFMFAPIQKTRYLAPA
jgi:hypothetical protein